MATFAVETTKEAGQTPTYNAAAAGGDAFANGTDERTFIHVKNTNGATRTVTVTAQDTSIGVKGMGQLTRGNVVVVVAATTGDEMIGPFSEAFNDASGLCQITYSAETGVTVAVIKVPTTSL